MVAAGLSTCDRGAILQRIAPLLALAGALALAAAGDPRGLVAPVATAWGLAVAAAWAAGRLPDGPAWAWALAVRAPLLLCAPTLSDDVWRYVWEGRVWLAGFNPFVHAPDAPALAHLRDAAWASVNHRHVPSVYPPLAQALFVALSAGGPLAFRVVAAAADVGTAHLLERRDRQAGVLWALLPLPALETAVSGHLEGVGALLLVAALGGRAWAAWGAAMVKLLPGVLLWLLPPRRRALWATLAVAACVPVMRLQGLSIYQEKWAYNASVFALLEAVAGSAARGIGQALGATTVAWILWRSRDPGRVALWTFGAFTVLSPVVHPWYALWPLAAGLWNGMRAWTLLAATIPLSYVVLASYDPATSAWVEPAWARWFVYAPFYVALLVETWRRATRAGPAPVH